MRFLVLITLCLFAPAALAQPVPQSAEQMQMSFSPVVKQAAPAVVNIYSKRKVVQQVPPLFQDPFFRQFFGDRFGFDMPRERIVQSLGSGVIVDEGGTLVTSYHVVEGADDIIAVLSDKREFPAKIVRVDEQSDLAMLKMDAGSEHLPHLKLRDSDTLEVGDLVLAIGNPFGVGQTVTSGIISALARSAATVNDYQFFIQTDAAINPGNSGGALVDMNGALIGVNTAIYSRSGGSNGVGFAIPSNMVRALLTGSAAGGRVVKPWLGATYQPLTSDIAESMGLKAPRGVLVAEVAARSPAEKGGLEPGDVISAINGQQVDDVQALRFRTAITRLGDKTSITLLRNGEEKQIEVTMTAPPEDPPRDTTKLEGRNPLNGLTVANLNPALALELNMLDMSAHGVVVIASPVRSFVPGDILFEVNRTEITSVAQLKGILENGGLAWRIGFVRDGQLMHMQVVP